MDKLHHQPRTLGNRMAAFKSRCERLFAYSLVTETPGLHPLKQALSPFTRRPHILVVDDNPANLGVACELLRSWGITPMLAANGAEAVALACGHDFDLILMDLQMPILDGLAATKKIRLHEQAQSCARATVLAYTSCALEHDVLLDCGVDGVLEKPCDAMSVQECLFRWCIPRNGFNPQTETLASARSQR